MKAALGIMTTDTQPKMAMEECMIGNSNIKIFGVAKGSGMIQPNMATTLGFIFTDADISNEILKKLLKKNIETTFNAISCDSDTSTNDMVSIFSTGKAKHAKINNINGFAAELQRHSNTRNIGKGIRTTRNKNNRNQTSDDANPNASLNNIQRGKPKCAACGERAPLRPTAADLRR